MAAPQAIVRHMEVGPLQCNLTLIADPMTREGVLVDPGGDSEQILELIKEENVKIVQIVLTHSHFDHCLAAQAIHQATGAQVMVGEGDIPLLLKLSQQCQAFGMAVPPPLPPSAITPLRHGDTLMVMGGRVIHTPGHSPGSSCFHFPSLSLLLSGDTLFRLGVGRTDLWGGDTAQLTSSIRERLLGLPGHTKVVPGHGPSTTIAAERDHNPFVGAPSLPPPASPRARL